MYKVKRWEYCFLCAGRLDTLGFHTCSGVNEVRIMVPVVYGGVCRTCGGVVGVSGGACWSAAGGGA